MRYVRASGKIIESKKSSITGYETSLYFFFSRNFCTMLPSILFRNFRTYYGFSQVHEVERLTFSVLFCSSDFRKKLSLSCVCICSVCREYSRGFQFKSVKHQNPDSTLGIVTRYPCHIVHFDQPTLFIPIVSVI